MIANVQKKLFYKRDSCFVVVPKLQPDDLLAFQKFISWVKSTGYTNNCFFWDFDVEKNMIVINDSIDLVENDIFDQLTTLVYWLFQRNYNIKGFVFYQVDDLSEFIYINGNNTVYHHTMLSAISGRKQKVKNYQNMIKHLQTGLDTLENKVQDLEKTNNFLWKLCSVLSIFTIGSFFLIAIAQAPIELIGIVYSDNLF